MSTTVELVGRQAAVTFSGLEGGAIGSQLYGRVTREDIEIDVIPVERFMDQAERLTQQIRGGTVDVSFTHSSFSMVPPTGMVGALTVYSDAATQTGILYAAGIVTGYLRSSTTRGASAPQRLTMTFLITATGAAGTDPISPFQNTIVTGQFGYQFNQALNSSWLATL